MPNKISQDIKTNNSCLLSYVQPRSMRVYTYTNTHTYTIRRGLLFGEKIWIEEELGKHERSTMINAY